MYHFINSLFILFALLFSISTGASEFWSNAKEDLVSPFTTDALTIFEVGGGLTLLAIILKDESKKLQKNLSDHRPLKSLSKIGDFLGQATPNIAYALFMGGDYYFNKDQKSLDRTILMAKATLYAGAITDIAKIAINEKRPNGSNHSFPSGHSTTAFAFSSVVMMEHSLPWGIAANAMATFVGVSRMNDNAHYLQDVLAGATIGTMYGVGLYYAQKKREESNKANTSVFLVIPTERGLAANYSVDF
ncbi:MAG: phosphatase PAP2 family protein [Bacteriovorax sp.]|nr:phosphatase PAP2 family protein [Bacteriovorax sp.]